MTLIHQAKRLYMRLVVRVQRYERARIARNNREFDRKLKAKLIVGEPHHTTKPLSETYMDSLK
jgi:hypothetical protein